MFISFEGGEGSGKTTLINRVYDDFFHRRSDVVLTKAPGGTQTGELIRNLLLGNYPLTSCCELFLFLADRAQHVKEVIAPALKNGITVLCDRFNDSTLAYQGAARGLDTEWVHKLSLFATENLEPDLTLYLDNDPHDNLSRVRRSKDRIEEEGIAFHEKVRSGYLQIAKKFPGRFHILNAAQSPDNVYHDATRVLQSYWK